MKFVQIDVLETYGAEKCYMNQLFLFESFIDEPNVSYYEHNKSVSKILKETD